MIVADTHVHVYACFRQEAILSEALKKFKSLTQPDFRPTFALFLTERRGEDYFKRLSLGEVPQLAGIKLGQVRQGASLQATRSDGETLVVFAGRQIATRERLEVLALASIEEIPDGLSFRESVEAVQKSGGIAVLPWSPGKWSFGRGKMIREILEVANPTELLLSDSSLRPHGFPEPEIFSLARSRGMKILAGSDPLPFAGQESLIASFVSQIDAELDLNAPVTSIAAILRARSTEIKPLGKRSSMLQVAKRLLLNKMSK